MKVRKSLQHSSLSESDVQKYMLLSRVFLCKAMECIYSNRCPKDLSDLVEDEEKWFSLNIPKSESLRQLVSARHSHGWFKIEIILTDPDIIVERWTLLHLHLGHDDVVLLCEDKNELKNETYKNFSKVLRSVYSMLNALPTKTIDIINSQVPTCTRRITAECSQFNRLPIKENDMTALQSSSGIKKYKFGPVFSPIGKCIILCESIQNIDSLLPRFRCFTNEENEEQISSNVSPRKISFLSDMSTTGSFYDSPSPCFSSFNIMNFDALRKDPIFLQFDENGEFVTDSMIEFTHRIEEMKDLKAPTSDTQTVKTIFNDVQYEITRLQEFHIETEDIQQF